MTTPLFDVSATLKELVSHADCSCAHCSCADLDLKARTITVHAIAACQLTATWLHLRDLDQHAGQVLRMASAALSLMAQQSQPSPQLLTRERAELMREARRMSSIKVFGAPCTKHTEASRLLEQMCALLVIVQRRLEQRREAQKSQGAVL